MNTITEYIGEDGVPVVQIDTAPDSGRVRINLNDAPIWDGDPEIGNTHAGEESAPDRPYTVVLLYPDEDNLETFTAHVRARNVEIAIGLGREAARAANPALVDDDADDFDGSDFRLLEVYDGHCVVSTM